MPKSSCGPASVNKPPYGGKKFNLIMIPILHSNFFLNACVGLFMVWKKMDDRTDASPWPLFLTTESYFEPLKESMGHTGFTGLMVWFQGKTFSFYETKGEWNAFSEKIVERIKQDPSFVEKVISETYARAKPMLNLTENVFDSDLKNLSNEQLWDFYDQYNQFNKSMRAYATIAPALDFGGFFSAMLEDVLKKRLQDVGLENELGESLAALTSSEKHTQAKRQDVDMLRLAAKTKSNSEEEREAFVRDALEKHVQQYAWLPCTYEAEPFTESYFRGVLQGLLNQNPEKQLQDIEQKDRDLAEKKKAYLAKIPFSDEEKRLFDAAAKMGYFKADRKDLFFKSYYQMRPLFNEIAKRLGLSAKQVKYLLPNELKAALLQKTPVDADLLNERFSSGVMISDAQGTRILLGAEAQEQLDAIEEELVNKDVSELKGQCAQPGVAKGVVRLVLSASDMGKMNEGDVLVAHATNPDIVSAMKKASAIVTNTGGVTCHAAIVSRELGVPCVIGTKVATDVLKDGDVVFVDASKGLVKKVS